MAKKYPLKQSRLNYILISESLSNLVENIYVRPSYRSDHSAVVLEVKFNMFDRGRGLWKFNNSLLTDKNYIEKVKQTIDNVTGQYMQNVIEDSSFIDVLLMEIRGATISYSSYVKKERSKKESSLMKDIENLESQEQLDLEMIEEN